MTRRSRASSRKRRRGRHRGRGHGGHCAGCAAAPSRAARRDDPAEVERVRRATRVALGPGIAAEQRPVAPPRAEPVDRPYVEMRREPAARHDRGAWVDRTGSSCDPWTSASRQPGGPQDTRLSHVEPRPVGHTALDVLDGAAGTCAAAAGEVSLAQVDAASTCAARRTSAASSALHGSQPGVTPGPRIGSVGRSCAIDQVAGRAAVDRRHRTLSPALRPPRVACRAATEFRGRSTGSRGRPPGATDRGAPRFSACRADYSAASSTSASKQVRAPVWQAGPTWSTMTSRVSPSQSSRTSLTCWRGRRSRP